MNKYRITYTRTLILEKTIEAESFDEADRLGQEIEDKLQDKDFEEANTEFEIGELKLERGARVRVIAEGKHKGDRGTVYTMMPYSSDETPSGTRWEVEVSIFGKGVYFWEDEIELI